MTIFNFQDYGDKKTSGFSERATHKRVISFSSQTQPDLNISVSALLVTGLLRTNELLIYTHRH